MKISTENKQAIYESVMNALSKTVKGVLDKKVNESKEIEDVYYAKTSDGKYVIYLTQHFSYEHQELCIGACANVLDGYSRKFKHGGAFDTTHEGDFKFEGEYAENLFRTEDYYIRGYKKDSLATEEYNYYYKKLKRMFADYIGKYSIKTYDEFITNLDKDGSPLLKVFDEVKVEQSQNKNSSAANNDIPTNTFTEKINGFDKKAYVNYRKDLTYEYGNLLSRIDNLEDSNAKVYAIMYLNHINDCYKYLMKIMPSNPSKAIKILNELAKVTQKYILDDNTNFGQK